MAGLIPNRIAISSSLINQLIAQAIETSPLECCGLLAGTDGITSMIFPIPNVITQPNNYTMSPAELVKTFFIIEELGLHLIGMYHSHPFSEPIPSETDIENCFYPNIPQLIIGKNGTDWEVRSFIIRESGYLEISIDVTKD